VGILPPSTNELFIYNVTSKVTSDRLSDRLEQWWEQLQVRFGSIRRLVLNLDNGSENQSWRRQFIQHLFAFADRTRLTIKKLCYY